MLQKQKAVRISSNYHEMCHRCAKKKIFTARTTQTISLLSRFVLPLCHFEDFPHKLAELFALRATTAGVRQSTGTGRSRAKKWKHKRRCHTRTDIVDERMTASWLRKLKNTGWVVQESGLVSQQLFVTPQSNLRPYLCICFVCLLSLGILIYIRELVARQFP